MFDTKTICIFQLLWKLQKIEKLQIIQLATKPSIRRKNVCFTQFQNTTVLVVPLWTTIILNPLIRTISIVVLGVFNIFLHTLSNHIGKKYILTENFLKWSDFFLFIYYLRDKSFSDICNEVSTYLIPAMTHSSA